MITSPLGLKPETKNTPWLGFLKIIFIPDGNSLHLLVMWKPGQPLKVHMTSVCILVTFSRDLT